MNEQKQIETIAKSCGWSWRNVGGHTYWWHDERNKSLPPGDDGMRLQPNYLNSRDAMAVALAGLTDHEKIIFWDWLYKIVTGILFWSNDTSSRDCFDCLTATPAQLAEAFLRTKGLWEDEA